MIDKFTTADAIKWYNDIAKTTTYHSKTLKPTHQPPPNQYSTIDRVLACFEIGDFTAIDRILGFPKGLKKPKRGIGKHSDRSDRRKALHTAQMGTTHSDGL